MSDDPHDEWPDDWIYYWLREQIHSALTECISFKFADMALGRYEMTDEQSKEFAIYAEGFISHDR